MASQEQPGLQSGFSTPTTTIPMPGTPGSRCGTSSNGGSGPPGFLDAPSSRAMIAVEHDLRRSGSAGSTQVSHGLSFPKLGDAFDCPKCRKRWPLSDAAMVGNQQWCIYDRRSYASLQARWAKNVKLRNWWNSLSPETQTTYYLKWQSLNAKDRYRAITYCEEVAMSIEDIEDETDNHIPLDTYVQNFSAKYPGTPFATMEANFVAIVNSCRSECLYRRDQWLIPVFEGVKRIKRRRHAETITASREAELQDPRQVDAFWAGGKDRLERLATNMAPPVNSCATLLDLN